MNKYSLAKVQLIYYFIKNLRIGEFITLKQ